MEDSNNLDFLFKPIVLITGFGPFADNPINASWEAVKLMNTEEIEDKHRIELVKLEIPVTYDNVDEFLPALWETHSPKLTIHVGVSRLAKEITIESQAHRKGYKKRDYFDKCPENYVHTADGAIRIQTKIDVEKICSEFNAAMSPEDKLSAISSKDCGRFLCEYIYYYSLSIDNTRTLFIHVPLLGIYSAEQSAKCLEKLLDLCLDQINKMENTNSLCDQLKGTNLKNDKD